MMRGYFWVIFIVLLHAPLCAAFSMSAGPDPLLNELNQTIQNKEEYIQQKQARIEELKSGLDPANASLPEKYRVYNSLYNEYKTFQYDSAFVYAVKLQKLAHQLNDPLKSTLAKLKLSFTLLSSGMYKEALDSLNSVSLQNKPDSIKAEYYTLKSRVFYELAGYNADSYYSTLYVEKGNAFSDSAIAHTNKESFEYYFLRGIKELKEKKYSQAKADFQTALSKFNPSYGQYAMAASALASVYIDTGEPEKARELMVKAAIADAKSSTKEGLALAHVANLLYQAGEEGLAYTYIKEALQDAVFYGARQRMQHVSSILPIIEGDRLATVESQKQRLILFAVAVSVLSLLVVVFAVIIFRQLKQLKLAKQTVTEVNENLLVTNNKLQEANLQLKKTNDVLQSTNEELLEAHKIKEEYIGYSFNMYSEYLDKIEKIKKTLEKRLAAKSLDGIGQVVDSINLKKEREALYLSFDKIFIQLFPNFISAFNSFFKEEDQFVLSNGQPLNNELRIFALMRIGISDHEQIAKILEYSVRTVYNNKTKVKNKSLLSNDEFESRVMEIKAF